MGGINENLEKVRGRLEDAARRAGRSTQDVRLLGISKRKPVEDVLEAYGAGLLDFGENRIQEAVDKIPAVGEGPRWHFVGHLQSNKAKPAAELFSVIHSIDSVRIANRLSHLLSDARRTVDIMIQVDLAGEKTKYGLEPQSLEKSAAEIARLPGLNLVGLMTIPPFMSDPEDVRPYFRRLRKLKDELNQSCFSASPLTELSMGMTHDFEIAVEEGATWIRVGTAIFGERAN